MTPSEQIKAALDAGPTEGPWLVYPDRLMRVVDALDNTITSTGCTDSIRDQWEVNAAYIAACNPANIRALLVERSTLIEQTRQQALSIISIDGQAQTMMGAIVAFCRVQQSADQAWREQPHVAPLFEIARAAQEAAK
jgi:hypothetical protein